MNELSILNRAAAEHEHEPGFLRRQFAGNATHPQITFDILVGIVLPVLCLVYDPVFFRGGFVGNGGGILKDFQLFAYSVIGLEVLTLMLWLWWGARAGAWLSAIGGILVAGALFSFTIALVLLPLSLIGLFFYFIGALGFTPFVTAFIYLRNGRRALKAAVGAGGSRRSYGLAGPLLLGVVFALGVPALAQWKVSRMVTESVAELVSGDKHQQAAAAQRLKYAHWIINADLDELVWAYGRSTDQAHKDRLARTYRELTGQDIERRMMILLD
jgi:hypothetical protein